MPLPGEGSITITLRDVWTELRLVSAKVDTVDHKVTEVDHKVSEVTTDAHDHEVRLRALEKARWPLPALAVLISVTSIIVSVLLAYHH
jgi:hypothetical protein